MSSEAICLVIDTGLTASQKLDGSRQSFLEASLECASLIVERRLFSESKDELALILFGTQAEMQKEVEGLFSLGSVNKGRVISKIF